MKVIISYRRLFRSPKSDITILMCTLLKSDNPMQSYTCVSNDRTEVWQSYTVFINLAHGRIIIL